MEPFQFQSPPPPKEKFWNTEGFREILAWIKKPWVILLATALIIGIVGIISVNEIMSALLHSRPEVMVPNIEKKNVLDALENVSKLNLALVQDGLEFDEGQPAGTIVRQHPPAGMRVREKRAIRVVVSKGGQVVFVPAVVGMQLNEAQSKLASQGLQLGAITEVYTADKADETVLSHEPDAGAVVTRGALIDLVVSKGAPPEGVPLIPNFVGQDVEALQKWAQKIKAKVKVSENQKAAGDPGTIVTQSPAADQPVVDNMIRVTIVPQASGDGFRLRYKVPAGQGKVKVRIQARDNKGEYDVYEGNHKGGDNIAVPMNVQNTTRIRIYLDGRLDKENLVEP